jgi:uncharacterized membrane protein YfcA
MVVLATLSVLTGAALQSATGLGFAMVASPALLAALGPGQAVTTLLVLGILLALLVLLAERRTPRIRRRELRPVIVAAIPGLVLGALILHALPKHSLQIAAGAIVVASVALHLRTAQVRGGTAASVGTGALTGVLSTATGISGPFLALWLQRRVESPEELRDSLAAAFLALSILGALVLAVVAPGRFSLTPWRLAILAACVAAGRVVGRRVFERLPPRAFRAAGLTIIAAAGIASVVAGVA